MTGAVADVMTDRSLTRSDLAAGVLLQRGRFANADLLILEFGSVKWVVKDFSPRSWFIRWTIGLFFTRREFHALRRCEGLPGTPHDVQRIDALALAYRFVEGLTLKAFVPGQLDRRFFLELEARMRQVHERRIVHLDIRNRRNVLCTADGHPVILDFQSSLSTRLFPRPLRTLVEESDMSGVYKHWLKYSPTTLDDDRRAFVARVAKLRWLWIFRGYAGVKPKRKPRSPAQMTGH